VSATAHALDGFRLTRLPMLVKQHIVSSDPAVDTAGVPAESCSQWLPTLLDIGQVCSQREHAPAGTPVASRCRIPIVLYRAQHRATICGTTVTRWSMFVLFPDDFAHCAEDGRERRGRLLPV